MKNLWDDIAKDYDNISKVSQAHHDKFDYVAKIISDLKPKTILDIGCGSGLLEEFLIKKSYQGQIEALDFSKKMLGIAKVKIGDKPNITFNIWDLNDTLPYKEESFDCIVAINVIFFLAKPEKLINNLFFLLNENGYLILINPKPKGSTKEFFKEQYKSKTFVEIVKEIFKDIISIKSLIKVLRVQRKLDNYNNKGRIKYQDFNEIKDMLESVGFIIERCEEIQAKQNWIFVVKKKASSE
ncbi:MAG: hypothetical protein UT66_C0004G0045 [candidate division CPR2 bacterium GW2011_GWC1_39_9]|uniref:Malonyl-CoA O-methyltransferase BioC 1 n=1 Tax=candidate division CPR2 bacterium GW2011_GWC2_39_10 TaxID=1618345 RepID=A0A0G0LSL1_UNCC2|nr:MAG: Malonyl-CoA O-methyltransferase BioC 1 [candidate division CPR2 bacterium GW2011_GWC2_39_10]KKR36050.1 MAG: hypothetical protein UT66_C0004G0045 [candidate division CPR2 bacterium GW2011_GWC1_39_9]